jgi:crossover junction endodeoxyribonuclease RuvC
LKERIILGIDPGTSITGYGLIKAVDKNVGLLAMGVIKLKKIEDPYLKLKEIFFQTVLLIDKYCPDEFAIEAPFYGKNVQSMLKLGRAQGVAIAAALQRDIPITEYAPRKVKMAITGQGSASKEQVAAILKNILGLKEISPELDSTDALAVALCHFYQKSTTSGKNYRGWDDFLKKNPSKIVD